MRKRLKALTPSICKAKTNIISETRMTKNGPKFSDRFNVLPSAPKRKPKKAYEIKRPILNVRYGAKPFCVLAAFHCFVMDKINPPTNAAQLERPAIMPKIKNKGREESSLTLTILVRPSLFKPKN